MFCRRLGHFSSATYASYTRPTTIATATATRLRSATSQTITTRNTTLCESKLNQRLETRRYVTSLSPKKITEILSANGLHLETKDGIAQLPSCVKSLECNQLASNNPIEDRLRISSLCFSDSSAEPTLILSVFDGHGGGTTADLISRRLFNYIALSLHPDPSQLDITNYNQLNNMLVDIQASPKPHLVDTRLLEIELDMLNHYRDDIVADHRDNQSVPTASQDGIVEALKSAFQRCDDDLSREIQENLISSTSLTQRSLHHYLSAAVSGCCAIVLVLHQGVAYLASSGDCRAVLGVHDQRTNSRDNSTTSSFRALELNDEHNCDNISEVRRLAGSHPKSEQNTMIRHNRLLGHLMPFRAFGDFNYKWPADITKACGVTRAFGPGLIPANYETPPYLIVEPDVKAIRVDRPLEGENGDNDGAETGSTDSQNRYLVMATDGLWELFESSRDVVEAIIDHQQNASQEGNDEDYDANCATYILRSALRSGGPIQEIGSDQERLRKLYHVRLESTLTLPKSVVRNFRDDISIILLKMHS